MSHPYVNIAFPHCAILNTTHLKKSSQLQHCDDRTGDME
jgi:hypothetical protein